MCRDEAGQFRPIGVSRSADINHADPIMRIEHRHRVARADRQPCLEVARGLVEERMEDQGRQREVVDAIYLAGDLNLLAVMGMDFRPALPAQATWHTVSIPR